MPDLTLRVLLVAALLLAGGTTLPAEELRPEIRKMVRGELILADEDIEYGSADAAVERLERVARVVLREELSEPANGLVYSATRIARHWDARDVPHPAFVKARFWKAVFAPLLAPPTPSVLAFFLRRALGEAAALPGRMRFPLYANTAAIFGLHVQYYPELLPPGRVEGLRRVLETAPTFDTSWDTYDWEAFFRNLRVQLGGNEEPPHG